MELTEETVDAPMDPPDGTGTLGDSSHGTGPSPGGRPTTERGGSIGRYVVSYRVGAGAMGEVYAAYDPELDRRVALKLLVSRSRSTVGAATRLLREAQALAKLNHPNVVAVHDVGLHDGDVFIAMEYVEGETLTKWLEPHRTWQEILKVFESAGRGLAAAHAKGLIHRDFKPDNVMVGVDGRVRVMDFGLARAAHGGPLPEDQADVARDTGGRPVLSTRMTSTGAVMGTPVYMAPEQLLAVETTRQSDQFSFCAAFYEALFGVRPFSGPTLAALAKAHDTGKIAEPTRGGHAPRWLRTVVSRGLATDPAARFESMDVLLGELRSGVRRVRRLRATVAAGSVVLLGLGYAGYGEWQEARARRACEQDSQAVRALWNADAREGLREGIVATDVAYGASVAERVMPWIDAQADAWEEATEATCVAARVERSVNQTQHAKSSWCLEQRRLELASVIEGLSSADAMAVRRAVSAVAGLPSIEQCTDQAMIARVPPPPPAEQHAELAEIRGLLARASYYRSAGNYERALEIARDARTRAEGVSWPLALARAWASEGAALHKAGQYEEAEAALTTAFTLAERYEDWETAATASSHLIQVVGYHQARHGEGKLWSLFAQTAVEKAGDQGGVREAARVAYLGNLHDRMGEYEQARQYHERAVELDEAALGPHHPMLAASLGSLGNTLYRLGENERARAVLERALSINAKAYGDDHPSLGSGYNNLANSLFSAGELEDAKEMFAKAVEIKERTLGPDHPDVASSLANWASVHQTLGQHEQARDLLRRALHILEADLGEDHPNVAMIHFNLGEATLSIGHMAEAEELYATAIERLERKLGPDHVYLGYPLAGMARALSRQGRHREAIAYLERALAVRVAGEASKHDLGVARFGLARALDETGSEARALELAWQARDDFADSGAGATDRLADVEEWLAERSSELGD